MWPRTNGVRSEENRAEAGPLLGIYHCASALEGGSAINFVFRSSVVGGEIHTTPEHPEVAFVSRIAVDALLAERRIRGQHVGPALAAADSGHELPAGLIVEVEGSAPPKGARS